MRLNFTFSFIAVALLILACFLPWITFEARGISFRGVDEMKLVVGTTATKEINWGKPAYFHLLWAGVFLLFSFTKKAWTKWVRVVAAAFNIAWTIRNFFLLPACGGGTDCPVRAIGLYLLLAAAILLFLAATLVTQAVTSQEKD